MRNTRWLLGLVLAVTSTLVACNTETSLGREGEDSGTQAADTGQKPQPETGCTYAPVSLDLSCNDDPNLPTVAGGCEPGGTCWCARGFVLNPVSKRCKLDTTVDGGAVICTVGADQTCNDEPWASWVAGTCEGGVACACKTGYLWNRETGKCKRAPVTDAGSDAAVGQVCTPLLDQTCNDDDLYSGTAGRCMKSFTCACNSGFAINPATGRCRAETKTDAAAGPDTLVKKDTVANTDTGSVAVDAPVGKDLGKDTPGVCTFGMDQTCNDSPIASWVAGTCQSDGTCVCGSGYVLVPSSGRCAYAPRDAGPDIKAVCNPGSDQTCNDSPASATWGVCLANGTCSCTGGSIVNASTGKCMRPEVSTCAGTYTACGCGCCGGTTPSAVCYYPSAGDSLTTIKSDDEAVKSSTNCEMAGCSQGKRYLCCTEAAVEPAGSAQYSAGYMVGGYDRIGLMKTENDGSCFSFALRNPGSVAGWRTYRLDVPTNWGLDDSVYADGCGSFASEQTIGAQGSITFTPNGASCVINAHMTIFFYSAGTGTISTMRIDADNVPISGGGPSGYCK